MRKILIIILILSIAFSGCHIIRTMSFMKKGKVDQEEFYVEIPFEYRFEHIIIKVTIDGIEYDFCLDSGASSGVSKELAQKLKLKSKYNMKIGDINDTKYKVDFVRLDTINIGGINFINTGATIDDYNISKNLACFKLDGIIGSNLMKEAIWEINPENHKIKITNSLSSLNIPANSKKIPFFQGIYHSSPKIEININGQIEKMVVVDLGSDYDIVLSKEIFDLSIQNNSLSSTNFGYGFSTSGLFGEGKLDTNSLAIVPNISFGDITLENQIVTFRKTGMEVIGLGFFKNYKIIFNWIDDEIILTKISDYNNKKLKHYGFTAAFRDNKIFIKFLYNQSSAEKEGLKIGDQILEIDGQNYENVSDDQWCEIYKEGITPGDNPITLIVLRNEKKLKFNLEKTTILE
jgi:uncharacterized protein YxeA